MVQELLVDAAQTAGRWISMLRHMGIDMLAFPGHKGLVRPAGDRRVYTYILILSLSHSFMEEQAANLKISTCRILDLIDMKGVLRIR